MSLKNGDRSRAHRLRAQRDKLRIKTRELRAAASEKAPKAAKAK
jgi:hypothetical protein